MAFRYQHDTHAARWLAGLTMLITLTACGAQPHTTALSTSAPSADPSTVAPSDPPASATPPLVSTMTRAANAAQATLAVTTATPAADLAAASPSSSPAARSATLAATATADARGTPRPSTATFIPASPPSRIATRAAATVAPPAPTVMGTGIPKEGTPLSVPNPTAMPQPTAPAMHPLPPPGGELVSVGERRLWIACDGSGGPTVVMDAGVNSGSQAWTLVEPGITRFSRVCIYDRAGLGRSDPIPRPRTSQEVVADLHGLLTNAEVPGPYVLVAHSFGGLNVRLYAAQFPKDVTGLVLVDPVHEDRFAATSKILTPEQEREFEVGREGNPEGLDYYESSNLVHAIGRALPNVPLIVIARGRAEVWPPGWPADQLEYAWRDLETDLASRAPQGKLWIASQSDHNIPGEQPQIVVDATRQVIETLRKPA